MPRAPPASYFNFINHLKLRNPEFEKLGRKDFFPANKNKKPSSKPGKGRKLPNRHDSVSSIIALAEFRQLNHDLQIINLCLDSAHCNYSTYGLCKTVEYFPFIDLNSTRNSPKTILERLGIETDGASLCPAGFRIIYQGYSPKRHNCK